MVGEPTLMIALRGHPLVRLADDSSDEETGPDNNHRRNEGGNDHADTPGAVGGEADGEGHSSDPQPEPSSHNQGEANLQGEPLVGPTGNNKASEGLSQTFGDARDETTVSQPAEDADGGPAQSSIRSAVSDDGLLAFDMAAAFTVEEPRAKNMASSEEEVATRSMGSLQDGEQTIFLESQSDTLDYSRKNASISRPQAISSSKCNSCLCAQL